MAVIIFGDQDQELFGSFSRALFTVSGDSDAAVADVRRKMFQISTGDGWVTDVVRPMNTGRLSHDFGINFFFVSYFLITNIVMFNIVVAVLLDEVLPSMTCPSHPSLPPLPLPCSASPSLPLPSLPPSLSFSLFSDFLIQFVNTQEQMKKEKQDIEIAKVSGDREQEGEEGTRRGLTGWQQLKMTKDGPLDPLLRELSSFKSVQDLHSRIHSIYEVRKGRGREGKVGRR
eukprot:748749-Hanusia_phi.AAC.1